MAEIRSLSELVASQVGDSKKFVSYKAENLLPPGENYGSEILKIEIKLLNQNGKEEILHAVGKRCPPNEFLMTMFNIKESFKRETEMYRTIGPTLNAFAKEKGVNYCMNFLATCYGARLSLNPKATELDEDAILLLENLYTCGYEVVDRFVGFNLESARIILENMAKMHAGTIAYKLANPQKFQENVLPHLKRSPANIPDNDTESPICNNITECLEPNNQKHLPKIRESFDLHEIYLRNVVKPREPFATLIHNDLWVNNIMIKFEKGNPVKNMLVDFQMMVYESSARDLLLFLYTSVQIDVLEAHIDHLLEYYHRKFIDILTKLQVDVREFGFNELKKEILAVSKVEFMHIMIMLRIILAQKSAAKDISEVNQENLAYNNSALHKSYYKKLNFVVEDFVRRDWI